MAKQKYEILEEINSGLYGKVFKAIQINLNRPVAAKIIKNDYPHAASELKHAEALARVAHENIVRVIDVEEVTIPGLGEIPAAIMEWVEGELLWMKFKGVPFTADQAKCICMGVLDGVECMHQNGLSHRDLHYGNIIITSNFTPKIIDIDVNQDVTLARLSTMSRKAAVNADIGHCRQIVLQCMRHARLSNVLIGDTDAKLQEADTLQDVRLVTEEAFEALGRAAQPPSLPNHHVDSSNSLAEIVNSKIELGQFASVRTLLNKELKRVTDELISDRFSANGEVNAELFKERVQGYEEVVSGLTPALAVLGYWGNEATTKLLVECIETVSNPYQGNSQWNGMTVYLEMRNYPVLLSLYSAAMGAYSNEKYHTLYSLLNVTKARRLNESEDLPYQVYLWKTRNRDVWNQEVLNGVSRATPISDHLLPIMREVMGGLLLDQSSFESRFDRFEYFLGVAEAFRGGVVGDSMWWGPIGRFIWAYKRSSQEPDKFGIDLMEEAQGYSKRGKVWPAFEAGFFDGSEDNLRLAVQNFKAFLGSVRGELRIW